LIGLGFGRGGLKIEVWVRTGILTIQFYVLGSLIFGEL
jgi:hypothetical protein